MTVISCIIPVFNSEKYLSRCIDSVVKQTYEDWELILVNDGSSDRSCEICKYYAKQDSRIHYIEQSNKGAAAARNRGIEVATGQFLMFVDSDDYIRDDYFEQMLLIQGKYDADMVVSSVKSGYSSSGKLLPASCFCREEYIVKALTEYEYIAVFSIWTKLIKKSIIDNNKIQIPEEFKLSEDRIFNLLLMRSIKKVATTNYVGYEYCDNPASLTHNRLNKSTLENIIKAEIAYWNEVENLINDCVGSFPNYNYWIINERRHALLAMDTYIDRSKCSFQDKFRLRSLIVQLLSKSNTHLDSGVVWRLFFYSIKSNNIALLSVWLWIMRLKQRTKKT